MDSKTQRRWYRIGPTWTRYPDAAPDEKDGRASVTAWWWELKTEKPRHGARKHR